MDGFKVGHVFVHLFLTVAGGFAHHQIGEIEDNRARSHGNFLRHESAIGADQRYPLLFEIHDGDKTFLAGL